MQFLAKPPLQKYILKLILLNLSGYFGFSFNLYQRNLDCNSKNRGNHKTG